MLSYRAKSSRAKFSKKNKGIFDSKPREILVWILQFFSIYEVASVQRFVSLEFAEAGQERIEERRGRTLFEQASVYFYGINTVIDTDLAQLLLEASRNAGCQTAMLRKVHIVGKNAFEAPTDIDSLLLSLKSIAVPFHGTYLMLAMCYQNSNKSELTSGLTSGLASGLATTFLTKAANEGNTEAMVKLASVCAASDDTTTANYWLTLAADKGSASAKQALGTNYYYGRGVEVDFGKCFPLWYQSARQGHSLAQLSIATFLMKDRGTDPRFKQNLSLSFRFFLQVAKKGVIDIAMMRVAFCYVHGVGCNISYRKAMRWYKKAEEMGNVDAAEDIALLETFLENIA